MKTSHTVHVDVQAHSHYLEFEVLHRQVKIISP